MRVQAADGRGGATRAGMAVAPTACDHASVIDSVPPEIFLAAYPDPMREIAETFRRIVLGAMPDVVERVRLGWRVIGYDVPRGDSAPARPRAGTTGRTVYICWIMPEPVHVHLGFTYGVLMEDPERMLTGAIPRARWVTRRPGEPIDSSALGQLAVEAARVARLSRGERVALTMDRELRRASIGPRESEGV